MEGKQHLLYRIGLPSTIAIPLALFVLIELLCFFVALFVNKHASLPIRLSLPILRDGFSIREDNGLAARLTGNTRSCDHRLNSVQYKLID